jgi:hypothetical protein
MAAPCALRTVRKVKQALEEAIESCRLLGCNHWLIGWAGVIAMAYVAGFEWDVFINYPMEAEDWAEQFDADLKKELALFLSNKAEVYFAKRNWGLTESSNAMLEKARKSCLFLAVLTRGSVAESENRFLRKEWEAFRASGSVIDRFIPISLKKIASEEILKVMPIGNDGSFRNSNARFFVEEHGVEFTLRPDSSHRAVRYQDEVVKVAGHIAKRLEEMRLQRGPQNAAQRKGPFSGKTVLLGRKEPRIETEWNEIHDLLRFDGVKILLTNDYPDEEAGFHKTVTADLSVADLFVQLLSPGDEWEYQSTDKVSRAKLQFNAAKNANSVRILQWCKPIKRERLDQLDPELFAASSLMMVGLAEFKDAIREALREPIETPSTTKVADKPYIYITADTPDWNNALDLQATAIDDTIALVMSEEKEKRQSDFAQMLAIAEAIIFLYGESDPGFVTGWLNEYAKLRTTLIKQPKIAALYRAPPKKQKKLNNPFGKDMVRDVGSEEQFNLEAMRQICAELRSDQA